MIRIAFATERVARAALVLLALVLTTSCGSGGVNGPVPVVDPTRITILPDNATVFAGLPTTFQISGGTGAYIVTSSNQAVIQVSGTLNVGVLTVVPNPVLADTTVTITVRDTGTAPTATANVTVKPGTVNNSITVTPTNTACGAQIVCSSGDAIVSTTIAQGGIPLAARGVRFDVVSGDYGFINVDPVTLATTISSSVTVTTDETGKAQARLRVNAAAPSQTALLQATDVGTGTFQRTSFIISQSTGAEPGFLTVPNAVSFQGALKDQCADRNGVSARILVFGGVPPYTVASSTSAFQVSPGDLSFSGGSFDITPAGICVASPGLPIVVSDSAGHTTQTLAANIPGTTAAPTLSATPNDVTLTSCSGTANVTVAGGAPVNNRYFATSGSDALLVTISGSTVTIGRRNPSPGIGSSTALNVGVSDGTAVANVTVHLSGSASGACPSGLTASALSVDLPACGTVGNVTITGGSGTYSASSSSAAVVVQVSGPTLSITRAAGSGGAISPATVTVRDAANPTTPIIPITVTSAATGC
ncbi:MAG TPA: hypothetical protein VLT89_05870 [Usitatibacter sp.]|nr:hypothetical protein [Usitatibacter sp.]